MSDPAVTVVEQPTNPTEQPLAESTVVETVPAVVEPEPREAAVGEAEPASVVDVAVEPEPGEPVEPKSSAHTDTPTLLEEVSGKEAAADGEEPKPADPPKTEPPADDKPPVVEPEPAPEPITYDLKLPEGVANDPAELSRVTELFGQHRIAPEVGQELVNYHAEQMQRYAQHVAEEQHRVFAETRRQWRGEVMADEEIGGAGHDTAMQAISRMRDMFVPEADRAGFNDFLRITGAGDHPAFLRLLHRVSRLFDEARPAPTPAAPAPAPKSGNNRRIIYDHPTSTRGR